MAVRCIEQGLCSVLTVEEVKHFLAVDDDSEQENAFIETLIEALSEEASHVTGRTWVESKWEWEIEGCFALNKPIKFPLCPVTKVEIYDLDEVLTEENNTPTDLCSELAKVTLPSLNTQGTPMIGTLLPIKEFPVNYKIVLTVGYPNKEIEKAITPNTPIELDTEKVTYTENKVNLVFNRPVKGSALPENFKLYVAEYETTENKETGEQEKVLGEAIEYTPQSVTFENGCIILDFLENEIVDGAVCKLSFLGGFVEDDFDNFLQPLENAELPDVAIQTESDFQTPNENHVEVTYLSQAPKAIKQWILQRASTLYNQRSQIASKGLGAMYGTNFIDGLLKQYKVVFR